MISLTKFLEIKKPIEITEETCERLTNEEEREQCYIKLIKKKKDPELCINLKNWGIEYWPGDWPKNVEYWSILKVYSECYWGIKILNLHREKGPIPRDVAKSDEMLERYLIENLEIDTKYCNGIKCFYIIRGNFDRDPREEIVVVIKGMHILNIRERENGFYITSWKSPSESEARDFKIEKLYNLQILKNQPEFIIYEAFANWGHRYSERSLNILTIESGGKRFFEDEFKLIQSITFEEYSGWDGCENETITKLKFKDLDKDGNLEIIKEGDASVYISVDPEEVESGYYNMLKERCKEEKERVYQIFKWNQEKQSFIEKTTEQK
jgi:hypothetical protein